MLMRPARMPSPFMNRQSIRSGRQGQRATGRYAAGNAGVECPGATLHAGACGVQAPPAACPGQAPWCARNGCAALDPSADTMTRCAWGRCCESSLISPSAWQAARKPAWAWPFMPAGGLTITALWVRVYSRIRRPPMPDGTSFRARGTCGRPAGHSVRTPCACEYREPSIIFTKLHKKYRLLPFRPD